MIFKILVVILLAFILGGIANIRDDMRKPRCDIMSVAPCPLPSVLPDANGNPDHAR